MLLGYLPIYLLGLHSLCSNLTAFAITVLPSRITATVIFEKGRLSVP